MSASSSPFPPRHVARSVDFRHLPGPFDVVGDVHGCFAELAELLGRLGYRVHDRMDPDGRSGCAVEPPAGRTLVLLGDLVDRGPKVVPVLRLVMAMVEAGCALAVPGNHDDKLRRQLEGHAVRVAHGLERTLAELAEAPPSFSERVRSFLEGLPPYLLLDGGRLVVAHAGLPERDQGRDDRRVRDFVLYGRPTGEVDEEGFPIRERWAEQYHGDALVVYGHTPVVTPDWERNTVNIDTGCVFGGHLSALRYPELEVVSVAARRAYWPSGRFGRLLAAERAAARSPDGRVAADRIVPDRGGDVPAAVKRGRA